MKNRENIEKCLNNYFILPDGFFEERTHEFEHDQDYFSLVKCYFF